MPAKKAETTELSVMTIRTGRVDVCILGTSPLIYNAVSEKARHELLLPRGRKTAADKAENLKHNPIEEYRASVYAHRGDDKPTRLIFPCGGFKKAMSSAALDLPGVKKAQIGRLVWINDRDVSIFGVPQLYMAVVRSADMNRTPDIRTRAILPEWGCRLSISFVQPLVKQQHIGNLLAAAGVFIGVGDGRQEKGAYSFGQFELVDEDDKRFLAVMKAGGRVAQDRALKEPATYDLETDKLLSWFDAEIVKLGDTGASKKPRKEAA